MTEDCICCGVCYLVDSQTYAPTPTGEARVARQPSTVREWTSAMERLDNCPVEAIIRVPPGTDSVDPPHDDGLRGA